MLLYSRNQNGFIFNFYVDDQSGKLSAKVTKDGKSVEVFLIQGLPWQKDLQDSGKKEKVRQALSDSYFRYIGDAVEVHPRGLGGWGTEIHNGLKNNDGFETLGLKGTYQWCVELGFSSKHAKWISEACDSVDSGHTSPKKISSSEAQGWHFDTNNNEGGPKDSRIFNTVDRLNNALAKAKSDRSKHSKRALETLGHGLHPLQDIFAHTSQFVHRLPKMLPGYRGQHHFFYEKASEADNPSYRNSKSSKPISLQSMDGSDRIAKHSQRYTNTRIFSLFYLRCYLAGKTLTEVELSRYVLLALELAVLDIDRETKYASLQSGLESICPSLSHFCSQRFENISPSAQIHDLSLKGLDKETGLVTTVAANQSSPSFFNGVLQVRVEDKETIHKVDPEEKTSLSFENSSSCVIS